MSHDTCPPPERMVIFRDACLMLARFSLAAWIGAAMLFVRNGVRLVTSGVFDSPSRDWMVLLRFPDYYAFGFSLLGAALLTGLVAAPRFSRPRVFLYVTLTAASLLLMVADLLWVYQPLAALVTPPGQPRTEAFIALHERSKSINMVHVGLALVAALTICWPSAACWRKKHSPNEK